MPTLTASRTVPVSPTVAWDVITDHEHYGEVAPNLTSVEVLEGDGVGMCRRCVDTDGNVWTETVTHWEEGRSFEVTVDVADSEFHRWFFHRFEGHWGLEECPEGVRVRLRFDYETRWGPLGRIVSVYFQRRGPPVLQALLDGWETEMVAREEAHHADGMAADTERGQRPNRVFR